MGAPEMADDGFNLLNEAPPKKPNLEIFRGEEMIERYPNLREPLIEGLLRVGETMNLISATKVGKSWMAINMALSLATGRPWMKVFKSATCRVLHIDTELHRETLAFRQDAVARAMFINKIPDNYASIAVRGCSWDIDQIGDLARDVEPQVIVIDALYRAMPSETQENDNSSMTTIYNTLDAVADEFQSAVIVVHHNTKGDQSKKATTDIGSGAGSISRAVDTHFTLVPHKYERHYVARADLRSWAPMPHVVLEWDFPTWTPKPHLDASELRSAGKAGEPLGGDHGAAAAERMMRADEAKQASSSEAEKPGGNGNPSGTHPQSSEEQAREASRLAARRRRGTGTVRDV